MSPGLDHAPEGAMSARTQHALSNLTRRRILRRLAAEAPGALSGAGLSGELELRPSVVAYHLAVLADTDLVSLRRTEAGVSASLLGADPSVQDALARLSIADAENGPVRLGLND